MKRKVLMLFLCTILGVTLSPIKAESSQHTKSNYELNEVQRQTNVHAGVNTALREIFNSSKKYENYKTGYSTTGVNIREEESTESKILATISMNTKIKYLETNKEWTKVLVDDIEGYIYSDYVSDKKTKIQNKLKTSTVTNNPVPTGSNHLTRQSGVYWYTSRQRESYYNLNMSGVIAIMRRNGYSEAQYPYWVRSDGCKMLGDYIMVAANLSIYPRRSIINTSLGKAIVADTGTFIYTYPYGVDVAVTW